MSESEFKSKSTSKSLSLKHYSLLHLIEVIQTHTFFQNILETEASSSLKYHLANWGIFPSLELSSCINPSAYFILSFSLFKFCHSPLRWQAEGWWWEGGDRKCRDRRGCQEWTERGSQRTHLGDGSPAVSAYVQLVCCIPMQTWPSCLEEGTDSLRNAGGWAEVAPYPKPWYLALSYTHKCSRQSLHINKQQMHWNFLAKIAMQVLNLADQQKRIFPGFPAECGRREGESGRQVKLKLICRTEGTYCPE